MIRTYARLLQRYAVRTACRSLTTESKSPYTSICGNDAKDYPAFPFNDKEVLSSPLFPTTSDGPAIHVYEERLPGVTTVIQRTMSQKQMDVLIRWRRTMTKKLGGEQQFKDYMSEILTMGRDFHSVLQSHLTGTVESALEISDRVAPCWKSISSVLKNVEQVDLLEKNFTHPSLAYTGFVDCVGRYKGELTVIEWKTSDKIKNSLEKTYDNPIQVAAYVGAVNACRFTPEPVKRGLIVVAYRDGTPAHAHEMNTEQCETYWATWRERLLEYWRDRVFAATTGQSERWREEGQRRRDLK